MQTTRRSFHEEQRNGVRAVEQSEFAGILGAGGDLGIADQLKDLARVLETEQQLLAAPAAGDEAHGDFHEAHVELGRGLAARAVEGDFAAAAEGLGEGRDDNGLRRVLDGHVGLLEIVNGGVEIVPLALLGSKEHHHEVRADGEVIALIGDDHGFDPAAVVGATDETTGQAVAAFVILRSEAGDGGPDVVNELRNHVSKEIGPIAKPRQIMVVPELPKTRSGKIMRRLLRDVAEHREMGDVTTLTDSSVMDAIRDKLDSGSLKTEE